MLYAKECEAFQSNFPVHQAQTDDIHCNPRYTSSSDGDDSKTSKVYRYSNNNTDRAIDKVNNPIRNESETWSEYNAHLAVSIRLQQEELVSKTRVWSL
jgi:hypothetical protein